MNKVAFFDFDETVFDGKSMFSFLSYFCDPVSLREVEHVGRTYTATINFVRNLQTGLPREEVNRSYYRIFRGLTRPHLKSLARSWYAGLAQPRENTSSQSSDWIFPWAKSEISRLKARGFSIVFVSGSFGEVIECFSKDLGVEAVLCAQLEECAGLLTGELVNEPIIGAGKVRAIRRFAQLKGINLDDCLGYGDHDSDLPMLEILGNATIVNPSLALESLARSRNWRVVFTDNAKHQNSSIESRENFYAVQSL